MQQLLRKASIYLLTGVPIALAQGGVRSTSSALCTEVQSSFVLGAHVGKDSALLPRVEIRRCDSGGLQLVAWAPSSPKPSLFKEVYRGSVGPVAVNQNIVAVVFPGGYDTVVVVAYEAGIPKMVFNESTHGEITVTCRSSEVAVTIGAWPESGEIKKQFKADEDELELAPNGRKGGIHDK